MKKLNFIQSAKQIKDPDVIDIHEEDIDMNFFCDINIESLIKATGSHMMVRGYEEFKGRAIRLNNAFDYVVGKDSNNSVILIPLKKK